MKQSHSILRKTGKAILWIVMIFFTTIIIAILLLKLSSVQIKIADYAAKNLSRKTSTIVDIEKIRISVFKSLAIHGLYLADIHKDTLLCIDEAKVEISFTDLLHKELNITSFSLNDAQINLKNEIADSLFNYNFLITAFADSTIQGQKTEESPWSIFIGQINISNVRLNYDDYYNGRIASVSFNNLLLKMDTINFERSYFKAQELVVEDLKANLRLSSDSRDKSALSAAISAFKLNDLIADLKNKTIAADAFDLSKSEFMFKSDHKESQIATAKSESDSEIFNINQLEYNNVTWSIKNLYYSPSRAEASVNNFTATDINDFTITQLETFFTMDQHSLTAENFKIKTINSSIEADINLSYPSLASLKDSVQAANLNLNLKNISIINSDIIYFNPGLATLDFFKNPDIITNISGIINGPVNDLAGKKLVVQTLDSRLSTNFVVKGLPDIKSAFFNITGLKIETGKDDLKMMAGSKIPQSIELPAEISLNASLKGNLRSFEFQLRLLSSYGSAELSFKLDQDENFSGNVEIYRFDLGRLLKNDSLFGKFSLVADAEGHGLNNDKLNAKFHIEVPEVWLKEYRYQNLTVNGTITGQEYTGSILLDDENASFEFNGFADLSKDLEYFDINFNLHGADLLKLNLTKEEIGVAFILNSEIRGRSFNEISGRAGIHNFMIARKGETHVLDSMALVLNNKPGKSELDFNSELFDLSYKGTISPEKLANFPFEFINNYFRIKSPDSGYSERTSEIQNFDFEIQLHDNLPLREAFFPKLKVFQPGAITGSFNSEYNTLNLIAEMKRLVYGTTEINNLSLNIDSDADALNFRISGDTISNSQISLENFLFEGEITDNKITSNLSSIDNDKNVKLRIRSQISRENDDYRFSIIPEDFYLMNNRWDISAGNYILLGKQGFLIHDFSLSREGRHINIASTNDKFKDDLNIAISNFNLDDISGIIQRDTSRVKGIIDGNVLLKRIKDTYGLIANVRAENLSIGDVSIGNFSVLAENPASDRFNIDAKLTGGDNDIAINGHFITKDKENSLNIKANIQSLSLKTVEVLSMGAIKESSGQITGGFSVTGSTESPVVSGKLVFNDVYVTPSVLNNQLHLVEETVQIKKDGIYFDSFQILDSDQNIASIDGSVKMDNFSDFVFALQVNANDFLLFNTTSADNKNFYGKLLIDSQLEVNGPMSLPVVNAKLKVKEGSNVTFSVSEKKLTVDRGEGIVEFEILSQSNPILSDQKESQTSGLTGFNITSVIEIDEQATLRVLLDPTTADSLVIRGSAALSFTIDPGGKIRLSGMYSVKEGSYQVSLESLIKRSFEIKPGSTITWNGDPMEAEISIDAIYSVRAAPIDLVADQLSGLSETDQNTYKQRYPFEVVLKLRGEILNPEINFEIQLLPEDKGIFGGSVNAKLNMLSENPSALNKQVFALLILGRFVQENPFETDAASSAVRSTVGRFLSDQLNQWSSKLVPGVELSFDVQSYNDYQSGEAEGRTQLDVGVKKQLFNERLSVQVEGVVDVEGEEAKQNSANDITSNVTIEYKLTEDGRFRLKGFRHNTYEGAIEGQIVETGAGIVYVREFNRWRNFFRKKQKE